MISYFYWIVVIAAAMGLLGLFGRSNKWKWGVIGALIVLLVAWLAYFFHFEQKFVKHYGGTMSITIPDGHIHMGATWKEDHLWIQNYDPESNTCIFNEYSRGNLLQGRVTIRNCNPLLPTEQRATLEQRAD